MNDLVGLRKRAESGEFTPYKVLTLALDGARTDELVTCEGEFIHAWTDGTLVGITIKFNLAMNDPIDLDRHNPIDGLRFWRIYLSNTAQAGKTLDLLIAREGVKSNI